MFIVGAVLLGLSLGLTTWAHFLVGRAGAGRRLPIFKDPPGTPKLASWLRMGGALLAVMFMMPLLAYALAEVVAVLSRLTPWPVTSADSRLALFWALLAVAPAMLLSGLTEGFAGPGAALALTRAVAGLGFLVIWGAGLRALAGKA